MTGKEIRNKFLKFFEKRGHLIMPSASLIPANDPSILWTAAGMVPFKPYFTGAITPVARRITTCQKCLRTPDIESVGMTSRHHTYFEMLGNFSFGDYFKEEAIPWAWEFVTDHLKLDAARLWVTIYLDDDESYQIWREKAGIPAERIVRMDKDTNFWEIGIGPCGPCSEIYIDLGRDRGCDSGNCGVGCECDRFLEIWNLVFIQYFRDEAGNYTPLTLKGIDTGMGLERVASVCQNVPTNFDTDLFREIIDFVAAIVNRKYGADNKTDLALKVIADHSRAVTFAVADGAFPSNEGRGYVLRRLLRRAMRFGRLLGFERPFLSQVSEIVIEQMHDIYPELAKNRDNIVSIILQEETRFEQTLVQGLDILESLIRKARKDNSDSIDGEDAFRLYDTYGFPFELTKEVAAEAGIDIEENNFYKALEEQRQRARKSRQETEYLSEDKAFYKAIRESFGETGFVGYEILDSESRILSLAKEKRPVKEAFTDEEIELVLDVTPCYAESGGQINDLAVITSSGCSIEIFAVQKPVEGIYVHYGKVKEGVIRENDLVSVHVDKVRRMETARNHTATHLLHKALKIVLGDNVNQAGSLVLPERLRFDFTYPRSVSEDELAQVEKIVNETILSGLQVETLITSFDEAKSFGATALFGEKYGDKVRVVNIGGYSLELCGGTHVKNTNEIGLFKLLSESSVGAGIRRLEAISGKGTFQYLTALDDQINRISNILKTAPGDLTNRVESVIMEMKELEQQNEQLRTRLAYYEVQAMLANVKDLNGIKLLTARTEAGDVDDLRSMIDLLRGKLHSGIIVLGSHSGNRVNLVAAITRDLLPLGLHAGKLIKELASIIDGGGGGKPEMAQAGGKDPSRLQEALDKVYLIASRQLNIKA
ncbi:MAG: Alanine--tRNA ligase [Desulfotomaculum sp. 46_296]|nr:MAG: Alanine--tRNA ligase [Desulfotomaculum sp. 46_296]HAU31099.1 alanine--tRNA ligase [Desulfotomaculum sp.]